MNKSSTCFSMTCGTVVPGRVERCPRCGSKMRSSTTIRTLGVVLLVIGIFLVGLMGVITLNMAPTLLSPGETIDGGRWDGTAEQGRTALMLFGLVIAFGFVSIVNGLWQIITGSRNRVVLILTLLLAAVLYGMVYYVQSSFGG